MNVTLPVQQLIPDFGPLEANGICIRCYRRIEEVVHLHDEADTLECEIKKIYSKVQNVSLSLPSPGKVKIEKRLLGSPSISQ